MKPLTHRRAVLEAPLPGPAALPPTLPAWAAGKPKAGASAALTVVDVQHGFATGGMLSVAKGIKRIQSGDIDLA